MTAPSDQNGLEKNYSEALLAAVDDAVALGIWPEGDFDLLRRVYNGATDQQDLVQRIATTARQENLRQDQIALLIAVAAHDGQSRYSGGPYIQHPLRVAFSFAEHEVDHRAVGLLHDVVEDCALKGWNDAALAACGITDTNRYSIACLTEKPEESNGQAIAYYARVVKDRVAVNVKIQDMTDNSRVDEWVALGILTPDGNPHPRPDNATPEEVAHRMKAADAASRRTAYAGKIEELKAYREQMGWKPVTLRPGC